MPFKDKEKQKEYFKKYREEHRKELLQKKRDYYKSERGTATRKKWREDNRDKVLASKRAEYARNKDRYREYEKRRSQTDRRKNQQKERYEKHKSETNAQQRARWRDDSSYREKRLAAVKSYRERNKDKIAVKDRQYAEMHADSISAYHKEYRKKNAAAIKPKKQKYNASRKIFYGKDPFHAIHRYFQSGYFRYISTFRNYLHILKLESREVQSVMNKLVRDVMTEKDALALLEQRGIGWTDADENTCALVVQKYAPKKLPEDTVYPWERQKRNP